MKKRRELDALVSNGKARRKTSKNGHELLRTDDTESSEIDEFSLSSQRTVNRKRGRGSLCGTCLTVLGYILVATCLFVCAGLIWMHFELKQSLDLVRDKIRTVETQSQGSFEDFQKLQSQIQNVNKTVQGLKTGNNGLDQVVKNLSSISKKILNLTAAAESLKQGLKDAPELKQIPLTVQALSNTVASLGSDVATMTNTVTELTQFKKATSGQLVEISAKLKQLMEKTTLYPHPTTPSGGREGENGVSSDDTLQKLLQLSELFQTLNTTLMSKLSLIQIGMHDHQQLLTMLSNSTGALQNQMTSLTTAYAAISNNTRKSPVASDDLQKQITDIVQETLSKIKLNGNPDDSDKIDPEDIDEILQKVDNFTNLVTHLNHQLDEIKEDHSTLTGPGSSQKTDQLDSSDEYVTKTDFQSYKDSTLDTIKQMDKTIHHVQVNVEDLSGTFTSAHNKVIEVSARMDGMQKYLGTLGYHSVDNSSLSVPDLTPVPLTTTSSTLDSTSTGSTPVNEQLSVTPPGEEEEINTIQDEGKKMPTTTTGTTKVTTEPKYQLIDIPIIKDKKELDLYFRRWDRDGDGQVDIKVLPDFLGPNAPDPKKMKQFDLDGNGKYSEKEFEVALGYRTMPGEDDKKEDEDIKVDEDKLSDLQNDNGENEYPDEFDKEKARENEGNYYEHQHDHTKFAQG